MEQEKVIKKANPFGKFVFTAGLFLVIGAALAGAGVYSFARQYPDALGFKTNATSDEDEAKKVVDAVSKLIDVPADETPTITIITGVDSPVLQTAFPKVKSGDRIVSYPKSGRSILYRPGENKIIDVGPFLGEINPTPTVVATATPGPRTMKVFIFNGANTVGATKNIESALVQKFPNVQIVGRVAAAKPPYANSLVVDLVGDRAEDVKKIADELSISFGGLPEGEKAPENVDFLLIVGTSDAGPTVAPISAQ